MKSSDLFTLSNGATLEDVTDISGTGVTWHSDNPEKYVELAEDASGDIELLIKVAEGVVLDGTVTLKSVTPLPKEVAGKGNIADKKAGDVVADSELFTYKRGATKADVTAVTGTGVTWDNTAKTLTIGEDVSAGDIALAFTVASGVTKFGSVTLKGVAAKPQS